MKFDVIVGNPPYQISKKCSSTAASGESGFWKKFIELSFSLIYEDGYVGLVVPSSWCGNAKLFDRMKKRGLIAINNEEASRYFPGVPIPIGYFLASKTWTSTSTTLIFDTCTICTNISDLDILPSGKNVVITPDILNVLHKLQSISKFDVISGAGISINKLDFKNSASGQYVFPCFYSAAEKSSHGNRRNIFLPSSGIGQNIQKVILTHTVDFKNSKKIDHIAPILCSHSVGKQSSFIMHDQPNLLRQYLFSFVGVFLDLVFRQKNYTINAIKNFPKIDFSDVYEEILTDDIIISKLQFIGFSDNEIRTIYNTARTF